MFSDHILGDQPTEEKQYQDDQPASKKTTIKLGKGKEEGQSQEEEKEKGLFYDD